jgi:uncharacterized protein (DUF1499 family)
MNLLWWLPTALIVALIAVGAGGAFFRVLEPGAGFRLFFLAILIALTSALVMSGAAALASARGFAWRGSAVKGAAFPVLVMVLLLIMSLAGGSHPIHDVTTDPELDFSTSIETYRPIGAEEREAVLVQQRELYPDVEALQVPLPPNRALPIAVAIARETPGWKVNSSNPVSRRIEVAAESQVFHFVDDVVIVIDPVKGGSLVQMRSRSRIGESDLGANADRIRTFFAALGAEAR